MTPIFVDYDEVEAAFHLSGVLLAMVFGPKTIGKPLLPMVLETKNHHKTIDINGDFPTIHSMAVVSIKTF